MQKLQFERAWDKTVSTKDRKRIEQIFLESTFTINNSIQLTQLWQAKNHKEELLVTVLINNTSQQVLSFPNTKLRYNENNEVMAEHTFTLPTLTVEPQTTMPWTFIFPVKSLKSHATIVKGYLEIVV